MQQYFSARPLRSCMVVLLLPLFLAACAARPPAPAPDRPADELFEERVNRLIAYSDWRTAGRAGFRTAEESASMSIEWRQEGERWGLDLRGPLGTGSVRLRGDDNSVVLRGSDGTVTEAGDAQDLLYRYTGYNMPVEVLRDWLRGMPSMDYDYQLELDDYGRPTELEQSGWRIRYIAWTSENGTYLPERVLMDGPDISVRAVLRDWELSGD